ncbi:retrovirus-related Pol polyprotein from transposon 17.6 [Trichonephila clavipes]|nr:retrovirus-related Pol polyprotein from transposon 17.6 [Trichonephila clavipes]
MRARRLKPTETLQEYFLTMRDLAHKGAVDDSSLIDYIINGIGRDRVESKGYFKNFITIQNTALPAKIHVVNDETIPLDAIIGINFLQQTQFTFERDGIRIFRDVDECKNDDVLVNLANLFDEQQCKLDLPHISNSKIRNDVEQLVSSYKPKKIYDTDLKMTILLSDDITVSQRSRPTSFRRAKNCRKPNSGMVKR